MKFRKFLKQWLGYTRGERTGSMVLLIVLIAVLGVRTMRTRSARYYPPSENPEEVINDSNNRKEETPLYTNQPSRPASPNHSLHRPPGQQTDPHQSYNDVHPQKEDLIDINRADSAELEALPGIGPVLSVRIIKYRLLLGYFYSIEQLNDVYGLDEDVIEMNRHRFSCDTGIIRKIPINSASYTDLLRHPYVNKSQVESIISYRQLSGSFTRFSDLVQNRIFSIDELNRLKPYLELR